jgi:hypothetical protein
MTLRSTAGRVLYVGGNTRLLWALATDGTQQPAKR